MVTGDIKAIEEEPVEEMLLVNAIKNADAEKKAKRDFEQQMNDFADRP